MFKTRENYREYLKGTDWQAKRRTKMERACGTKRRCSICSSRKMIDVHHLNYRGWYDVDQSDLRLLCRRCHTLAHKLMADGTLKFKSDNHHSRFVITKTAVKKRLGLTRRNMFSGGDRS